MPEHGNDDYELALDAAMQVIDRLDGSTGLSLPARLSTVTYLILEAVRRAGRRDDAARCKAASAGVTREVSA